MPVLDGRAAFGNKASALRELVKNPVCGMDVDPANACYTEMGGKKHYFREAGCKASLKKACFKMTNKTAAQGR